MYFIRLTAVVLNVADRGSTRQEPSANIHNGLLR